MNEQEKLMDKPMDEQEFQNYLANSLNLRSFEAVNKFKSVQRAFRRGHLTTFGYIVPNRPFHNRKNTCKRGKHSRAFNEHKKKLYGEYLQNRSRGV